MRHRPALRAALDGAEAHGDTVRIDRRTHWGNPRRRQPRRRSEQVIERYRAWLWQRIGKQPTRPASAALPQLRRARRSGGAPCVPGALGWRTAALPDNQGRATPNGPGLLNSGCPVRGFDARQEMTVVTLGRHWNRHKYDMLCPRNKAGAICTRIL